MLRFWYEQKLSGAPLNVLHGEFLKVNCIKSGLCQKTNSIDLSSPFPARVPVFGQRVPTERDNERIRVSVGNPSWFDGLSIQKGELHIGVHWSGWWVRCVGWVIGYHAVKYRHSSLVPGMESMLLERWPKTEKWGSFVRLFALIWYRKREREDRRD